VSTKDIERLDTFSVSGIEKEVCRDIELRQIHGIKKYGTSVANNTLTTTQWLQHAYEESLDLSIYLKKIITDIKNIEINFLTKIDKTIIVTKDDNSLLEQTQ